MKLIQYLFCVIFLGGSVEIPTENPCGIMYPREGDMDWGKGGYFLPANIEIPVYCDTEGSLFGLLKKEDYYHQIIDRDKNILLYELGNAEYIGHYSHEFLIVKPGYSDEYVQIYEQRKEGQLFMKKEELGRAGAAYFTYESLLFDPENTWRKLEIYGNYDVGVNLFDGCLYLREAPGTNHKRIRCIPGNTHMTQDHTRIKILDKKGLWAKVEVEFHKYDGANDESGEGCSFKLSETQVGWMKAIDDNGFPNIWYSVSAY